MNDSFEDGLYGWTRDAHVPMDPNEPGERVAWNITSRVGNASEGNRSVLMVLDGRQDDGTIWLVHPVEVAPETTYRANLTVRWWSDGPSFNKIGMAVGFVGAEPPQREQHFPRTGEHAPGEGNTSAVGFRAPLDEGHGWVPYSVEGNVTSGPDGHLYVAFGFSVIWETHVGYTADALELRLVPVG